MKNYRHYEGAAIKNMLIKNISVKAFKTKNNTPFVISWSSVQFRPPACHKSRLYVLRYMLMAQVLIK
jgi:hypothetical protein